MKRAICAAVMVAMLNFSYAQALDISDEKYMRVETVRAAMIYQLLRYIHPAGGGGAWQTGQVCVQRNPILFKKLRELFAARNVSRFRLISTQDTNLVDCDVLIHSSMERVPSNLRPTTLTIQESELSLGDQGMIALVEDNGRIRIDVNLAALNAAGYHADPDLLSVARKVLR